VKNVPRQSKHIPKCFLAVALCAAALFFGCGHKEPAPYSEGGENSSALPGARPAELPLERQTEQKLDPLTREDVELYLKVMRAAASRVNNPAANDRAVLDGARKILAGNASGRVPTPGDVKTLERANLVALSMDRIVAEEMKHDGLAYRGIVEAIESVVSNPALAATSGDSGASAPNRSPTPLEARLSGVNATNAKFLAPYREQIQELIAVVRNPANLPM
jgi:hypothetical protein